MTWREVEEAAATVKFAGGASGTVVVENYYNDKLKKKYIEILNLVDDLKPWIYLNKSKDAWCRKIKAIEVV